MLLGVFLVHPFSAPHEEHSSFLAKHHFDALKRYAGAPKRSPRAPIARATSSRQMGWDLSLAAAQEPAGPAGDL